QRRAWNFCRVQSKVFDCHANRDSIRVPVTKKLVIQCANQRAAANERCAEPDSFFLRKSDELDSEGKSPAFQSFENRNGNHYAENTIIGSGIRDRIEVRSEKQPRCISLCGRIEAAQISSGIDGHVGSHGAQPTGNLPMTITHRSREKRPPAVTKIFRERRQFLAANDNLFGLCADSCALKYCHGVLALSANACLDITVWLVDWHKNFIRVVLPKSSEIYQKIVLVRQGQLDFFNVRNIRKNGFTHCIQSVLHGFAAMSGKHAQQNSADPRS